jgi:hypothetical protein
VLQLFYNTKGVLLTVIESLRWLNNDRGVDSGFLASYLSAGFGRLFRYLAFIPIGWMIVQILRQHWRKTANTSPTTLSEIYASNQFTSINEQIYSSCD